jgi:hypothetical protein
MKIFLIIIAATMFVAPIAGWAYLVSLACAFKTSSPNCSIRLGDYWDIEFLFFAAIPWFISVISLIFASKMH